ncbi:unnamed protein product [Rotaria socialis]|uniref:Uncharacterized protein n=1 Tax=Rotaria socialis TaxID=392032 RepID=A0A821ATF4_9BILA|nr:unnamed protein product [Rotaria socialis]CAF4436597.1 unnamed protein product [Rotaria socialis]CAF4577285.1 unnamed protein product [Rotaria socialis]
MERILLAGNYPNLTFLMELFGFGDKTGFHYFKNDSTFRHIFKHQIADLTLHDNDEYLYSPSPPVRTRNAYSNVFALFENLKRLTIVVSSSINDYPPLSVYHPQSATCFASTLTV